MIVELYRKGKAPLEIISEYGLNKTVLYQWIDDRKEVVVENETVTLADIKKFKARIGDLEEENNILKKAMTIFVPK